ncbi:GTPase HflX [Blochmannia endosymbiont of Camponotus sp. C-003]|uniref:ribosome rescue GTPase HflX n=1 Tax=unclassified Candidatus Blochmanniella TaxID=711328 RepID=UPI002025A3B0|nr:MULTISPECIES: ribosome rescue GTPase HflX [unclassified Candidatus Blochmannia]URJ23154.1 GTPase HflX [Blochmannia endosymbiont of Camponotus sp. C-003]URJ28623.1 GTPase HflX [Blochmannia endosymbiont of Camponotus sp. C-046]
MYDLGYLNNQSILVNITFFDKKKQNKSFNLQECLSLASTAGMEILEILTSNGKTCNAKYFIGIGKVLELERMIQNNSVSIVLFNCILSPHQERNLMCLLKCKIIDRNQLILNIFAQRARTYEGKLQVRLAQLKHLNSRLVHEWSHLERQKGGIGLRGGSGEMQLESDRRLLRKEMTQILLRLKKIENQREQGRRHRVRIGVPTVSLVGYTNAGKSTLFNVMTASHAYTSSKLFATLDPTSRRIVYKGIHDIILTDTVGFIQNLPNDLVSSFKATLQETVEATLLLHVVDVSDEKFEQNINTVHCMLSNLNVHNIPMLLVMNKIDRLKEIVPHIDRDNHGYPSQVWISAQNNLGISLVLQAVNELLSNNMISYELRIPMNNDLCEKLYRLQVVKQYWVEDDNYVRLKIYLSAVNWGRLLKNNKLLINYIV